MPIFALLRLLAPGAWKVDLRWVKISVCTLPLHVACLCVQKNFSCQGGEQQKKAEGPVVSEIRAHLPGTKLRMPGLRRRAQ